MGTGRLYDIWATCANTNKVVKLANGQIVNTVDIPNEGYGICVDKNNSVWVTNWAGNHYITKIVNGVVTKNIPTPSYPGNICVDKDNTVWFTCSAGVCKIVNDEIVKTIAVGTNPNNICADKNGVIWVTDAVVSGSVYKIVNDVVTKNISIGRNPSWIGADKNNIVWVTCNGSVYKIVNDTVLTSFGTVNGSAIDKNGDLWANGNAYEIAKISNGTISRYSFPLAGISSMCIDNNNVLWISASDGIPQLFSVINGGVTATYNTSYTLRNITTGMVFEILRTNKHLIQSGTSIKSFDGTAFTDIGTSPATDAMFETYGTGDLAGLTKDKLYTLTNPKILTKKTDSTNTSLKFTGSPLPKVVLSGGDITISSSVFYVDNFNISANVTGTATMRIAFSLDSGTTWNAYRNGALVSLNVQSNSDFKSKGLTPAELNAITSATWDTLIVEGNKKIRFGYYLEVANTTDVVETDILTMQVDMNGAWGLSKLNTDYEYWYASGDTLTVNLITNGDFRIALL